ncbi:MAG: glycerophosphodiester phosphodiesterase family protein [Caldilinea sp.]
MSTLAILGHRRLILLHCYSLLFRKVYFLCAQSAQPLIIGHRGAVGIMPENTAAAYAFALEQGVDGIEFDVHLCRDGVPVVLHDPNLLRTTGREQFVHEMTFAELRKLDAAAVYRAGLSANALPFQKIPTLQEVLAWTPAPVLLCVELKTHRDGSPYAGLEEIVAGAVQEADVEKRTVFSSFNFEILERLRQLAPHIRRHAIVSAPYFNQPGFDDCERVADDLAARCIDWVAINRAYLTQPLADRLQRRGIVTHAWVINTVEEFTAFASLGVTAVTTDRPDLLCALPRNRRV